MNTSSRFAVAVHLLVMLALYRRVDGTPLKSERMAESADTNPVVVRRLLGVLQTAGWVESQPGPRGGFVLAVSDEDISLGDVYDAVEAGPLFHAHYGKPQEDCPVGGRIVDILGNVADQVRQSMRLKLSDWRISDLASEIAQQSGLAQFMQSGMSATEIHDHFIEEKKQNEEVGSDSH